MKSTFGQFNRFRRWSIFGAVLLFLIAGSVSGALAQALPGGSLDPTTIPKFVTPLVIPPVMKIGIQDADAAVDYQIAVRQFKQQILPGGIWAALNSAITTPLPPTTVWSYGPAADPPPDASSVVPAVPAGVAPAPASQSQFNYPAYTIENTVNGTTDVDWINDLKDPVTGNFLPHLLSIDQTLHWANPGGPVVGCADGTFRTDCRGTNPQPYTGPVPLITHVHGAHVGPESDGYPEAWYLPDANNIPAGYATQGTLVNQYAMLTNNAPGVASFRYPNDQPSTTLWYHDHALGMTRNNVYAGPAGFWLIRESGGGETGLMSGTLPGPAPVAGQDPNFDSGIRAGIREIPIAIQDRAFNADGSLFFPLDRAYFEGVKPQKVKIPFIGDPKYPSDISPIWNPEWFGNTIVVNGTTWPVLNVAQALYRFRLLNGCNSRFLNLSMFVVDPATNQTTSVEIPFYQIGAEQSLLPAVVEIRTGFKNNIATTSTQEALLMGLAERADVIVDFRGLADGMRVRMINTAPDAPFAGFPDIPSDPGTTGQVMEFIVDATLNGASPTDPGGADPATNPTDLGLSLPDDADPANTPTPFQGARNLALLEEESGMVCASVPPSGVVTYDKNAVPNPLNPGTCIDKKGKLAKSIPFAPKAAVLGINGNTTAPTVTLWSAPIETNPILGATETWELWNHTVDSHPIHLHLVKFKVVNRQTFDPVTGNLLGIPSDPEVTEAGWKDTVIAYPGEVTRLNATFDIAGLYVWHCHIVDHEDNEMMVPYVVGTPGVDFADPNGTIGGLF